MGCAYHPGHQCISILSNNSSFSFSIILWDLKTRICPKSLFLRLGRCLMAFRSQFSWLRWWNTFQPAVLIFPKALTYVMGSSAQTPSQLVQWITLSLSSIHLIFKSDYVCILLRYHQSPTLTQRQNPKPLLCLTRHFVWLYPPKILLFFRDILNFELSKVFSVDFMTEQWLFHPYNSFTKLCFLSFPTTVTICGQTLFF